MVDIGNFFSSMFGRPNPIQQGGTVYAPGPSIDFGGSAGMEDNALQQILGGGFNPQAQGMPESSGPPIVVEGQRPKRDRVSVLDAIGGIADVFAGVGGATPRYQANLDAQTDRERAANAYDWQEKFNTQKHRAGEQEILAGDNAVLGQAVRGLDAYYRKVGPEGIARAWPMISSQLKMNPDEAEILGEALQQDPENTLAAMMAATTDPKAGGSSGGGGFGLNPFYARGSDGKLRAYQLNKAGGIVPIDLPEGETPADPIKVIDTGDTQVVVGGKSGTPQRILPVSGGPVAGERPVVNASGQVTAYAPVPGSKLANETAKDSPGMGTTLALLDELDTLYDDLNTAGDVVNSENGTVGNVIARARASGPGQFLEGFLGTEAQAKRDRIEQIRPRLLTSIMQATGMSARQLDSNAELKLNLQTMTDPTKDYAANQAAIAWLKDFLSENAKGSKPAAPKTPVKRNAGGGPSVSNW